MKNFLLLALAILLTGLPLRAQTTPKVTVSARNEQIAAVFSSIEKQTGYTFVYSPSLINTATRVSLNVKDRSLKETLDILFSDKSVGYRITGKQIILLAPGESGKIVPTAPPARKKITGVVTDERGEPFPFVDVYVSGTAVGTVTDAKGRYELLVDDNDRLTFNFLGYEPKEIGIGKSATVNVNMALAASVIEETVVVAFGEQRKAAISSSISTVKADEIVKSPVSNISNAVTGRIPGLISMQASGQPGADESTLYIRGAGTWNNAEPLYVIDGVERNQAQFLRIDPTEIESFSILKDAAATAVYGSKGANGVVLVTTKRGDEGRPKVTFNSSITFNQPTRVPTYLNSYESLVLYNEALMNDGDEPLYTDAELEHYRIQDDPLRYPDTNWYDLMMKKFSTQENFSLSVRGGTKTVKYYISGTYMYQDGQLKTSQGRIYDPKFGYQRLTLRSNVDILVTKALTVSVDLNSGITDKAQPKENTAVFTNMNRIPSWIMPAYYTDADGNRLYAGTTDFPDANPMYMLATKGTYRAKNNTVNASVRISYDFSRWIKGLSASVRGAYDSVFGNYGQWTETQSTYMLISQPGRADRYVSFIEPTFYNSASGTINSMRKVYGEGRINYKVQKGSHTFSLSGVSNISDYRTAANVPYRSVSFIGIANYSFKNRYFIEANAAYRGSENFAPGHRFGLFPSVSAAWNAHNENFIKDNADYINNLKLRASYGITGNDYANTRFIYKEGKWTTGTTANTYFGLNGGSSNGYTTEPVIANPLATWEKAHQTNLGVDIAVLKNKFSLSVDRFFEYRTDILMTPNSVPGLIGIGFADMNIGKTRKDGWELDFAYRQKLNKSLDFYLKANYTYIHNEVIYKDEPSDMLPWQKQEGRAIGQQYGYVVIGYFADEEDIRNYSSQEVGSKPIPGDFKYLDYNADGVVNTYDRVAIGYPSIPSIVYGFSGGINYKRLSFDWHFQGAAHSSVFISNYLMYEFYNRGRVQDIHLGRWTPETAETATYPALHVGAVSQNHVRNTFFQKNNPYLRLKNVELAYNMTFKKSAAVKGLRVYLSGVNLITWDKLHVVDPETPTGSTGAIYPQTRGFSLGLNMQF